MNKQHSHSVRQLSFLASAHVLDLLCDVLDINSRQLARTQQRGLLAGPCHHVFLVTCVHYVLLWGHHRKRKKSYAKRALGWHLAVLPKKPSFRNFAPSRGSDDSREVKNADRSRTDENAHLSTSHSSAEALRALKARLQGCKRRKDSVELIEYMVMASPEQFLEGGNLGLDRGRAFFQETYQWLEKQHGAANVAWATIQYGESTPHLSVGVVPRVETPNGPKLAASTWLNGRKALAALQDRVAEIGRNYGLERGLRGSPAKHESVRRWYGALNVTQNDRRLQPVKLLEVPRAPHFVDKLAGRASEMQRVREQAEAHNRAARAHNRERMRLLAQMAGQGFGRRQSQKERARLEQEAKLEKEKAQQAAYQAEQAVLSKRTLALRAQQNDKVVQMLKTELAAQKEKMLKLARVVKVLIQELIKAAPERAHALGLIKTEPVLQRKPERGKGYSFER